MDEETYDTFKPTSVKPTVREYKVKYRVSLRVVHDAYSWKLWFLIYDFFSSAFINLENSIRNFKRKLKQTGNKRKKMTPKQKNGSLVLFFTRFYSCFKD